MLLFKVKKSIIEQILENEVARAKRHYIPGYVWHITHRCHEREFLFKFAKDRKCWMQWLYEAKKRFSLTILNFMVTSNHIHLLVYDHAGQHIISNSMQLLAGRVGQEYNIRKKRHGAFWQDRYHATAVETGDHLLRCIIYIDLNMVRTGVVDHPSNWFWSGYNEIQNPRKKSVLINYKKLRELAGFDSYNEFQSAHRVWVEDAVNRHKLKRESIWSESVAIGSETFVEKIKSKLGARAKGRKIFESENYFQLREEIDSYSSKVSDEKDCLSYDNTYDWRESIDFPCI